MSSVKNAVIAAAGVGSRLGLGMPKCMISVNRVPILARQLRLLAPLVETIVVVVGYREEMVIEYCQHHFRNVILARNPQFATTNTAQSLALGARFVTGKTLFLDGDLLLERRSLENFLRIAGDHNITIGVSHAKTEHPVFAECVADEPGNLKLIDFSRKKSTPLEWANLFIGPHDSMDGAQRYVFEKLKDLLPAPAALVDLEEVDTQQDLARAEAVARVWDDS